MKNNLKNYHPRALRKYISEFNKQVRAGISEDIKKKRKEFSEKLKAERKGRKVLEEIKIPKGVSKNDLVDLVLSRSSMKQKAESDFKNKTAFEGFEFREGGMNPIKGYKKPKVNEVPKKEKKETPKKESAEIATQTEPEKKKGRPKKVVVQQKSKITDFVKKAPVAEKPAEISDIEKILKDNNLKFSRYNKAAQLVYNKDTKKTAKGVVEAKLTKDKKDIKVRYKGASGIIKVDLLQVSPIGTKNIKKTKAQVAEDIKKLQTLGKRSAAAAVKPAPKEKAPPKTKEKQPAPKYRGEESQKLEKEIKNRGIKFVDKDTMNFVEERNGRLKSYKFNDKKKQLRISYYSLTSGGLVVVTRSYSEAEAKEKGKPAAVKPEEKQITEEEIMKMTQDGTFTNKTVISKIRRNLPKRVYPEKTNSKEFKIVSATIKKNKLILKVEDLRDENKGEIYTSIYTMKK